MKKLSVVLKELGLSADEIRIYEVVLEKGRMGVTELASVVQLHRVTTHLAVKKMVEMGILASSKLGRMHYISICDPGALESLLAEKKVRVDFAQSTLGELTSMMRNLIEDRLPGEDINVTCYKSKKALMLLHEEVQIYDGPVYSIECADDKKKYFLTKKTLEKLLIRKPTYKNRCSIEIAPNTVPYRKTRKDIGEKYKCRFIENTTEMDGFELYIFGNKIHFFKWDDNGYFCVSIKSVFLSTCLIAMHKIIWSSAIENDSFRSKDISNGELSKEILSDLKNVLYYY